MTSPDPHHPPSSPPIFRPWQSYLAAHNPPTPTLATGTGVRGGGQKRAAPQDNHPVKMLKTEGGGVGTATSVGVRTAAPPTPLLPDFRPQAPFNQILPPMELGLPMGVLAGLAGFNGPLPGMPSLSRLPGFNTGSLVGITPALGGLGSPLIPLLDVLVPAAEVERVCARRPRPKRFGCNECGSAFSNKGQLKGHVRIHTGERPYACGHEGCHKKFTRNEELTRHRRIHSGARPFPCPLCDKRFGRKDHLKKHIRTHQRHPLLPPHPLLQRLQQLNHLQ